jgi:hypothetical protein
MTLDGRLIVAAVGYVLVLALNYLLRGSPSLIRCSILAAIVALSVLGLGLLGIPDERGVLAFLLGMFGGLFVGHKASSIAPPERHRSKWLLVSTIPIGLGIGLGLFAVWYWQAEPPDRIEIGWYASVFGGLGIFAGLVAAAMLILLHRNGYKQKV